ADSARVEAARAFERAEALEREGAGQAANALAAYQQAATYSKDAGDALGEAIALVEVGRMLGDLGRTPDSTQTFTAAIAACRRVNNASCEGSAIHRLGRLQAVTGQPQQGFETLQQALEIRKRLGDV